MSNLFQTYEVGSLPKLAARVSALSTKGTTATEKSIAEFARYGNMAQVDVSQALDIFERQRSERMPLSEAERTAVIDANALINTRLQELWLDIVYDGEGRRQEMYREVVRLIDGFKFLPEWIRSRGPDSWNAAVCISEPRLMVSLDELPVIKEFEFVRDHASKPVKVPMDDPFMIANMSVDRHYKGVLRPQYENDPRKLRYEAKRALTLALAQNVIRPQVEAAVRGGAKWIQLDIPSATIDIEHIPILVDGVNAVVDGIEGIKFSLHICYPRRVSLTEESGYELLFPHVLNLNPNVNHFSLELANGDQYERDLAVFARYKGQRKFEIGAGLVDITLERQDRDLIETPETVRDRIARAAKILGDHNLVYAAPDCGLRQLTMERSLRLYEVLAKGAELARRG